MVAVKKDKKNMLVIPASILSSKISKRENRTLLLYYSFLNTRTSNISTDKFSLGFKHVKVLNDIIEKTNCSLIIIDNIVHYDHLNITLKTRGLTSVNKIVNIIDKENLKDNSFDEYKKTYNLLFVTTKKIYGNFPHFKVKPDSGLTLNDEIKIVSYFKKQPYKWAATRSIKSKKELYSLFEEYGYENKNTHLSTLKYCWS